MGALGSIAVRLSINNVQKSAIKKEEGQIAERYTVSVACVKQIDDLVQSSLGLGIGQVKNLFRFRTHVVFDMKIKITE